MRDIRLDSSGNQEANTLNPFITNLKIFSGSDGFIHNEHEDILWVDGFAHNEHEDICFGLTGLFTTSLKIFSGLHEDICFGLAGF